MQNEPSAWSWAIVRPCCTNSDLELATVSDTGQLSMSLCNWKNPHVLGLCLGLEQWSTSRFYRRLLRESQIHTDKPSVKPQMVADSPSNLEIVPEISRWGLVTLWILVYPLPTAPNAPLTHRSPEWYQKSPIPGAFLAEPRITVPSCTKNR